jgi:hypothetical protein
MHAHHFDTLARSLTGSGSRRRAVALALSGALGSALGVSSVQEVGAKKTKNPKPNSFGCLNVGQKCRGKDSKCCSGVCQGKKPKKGKKDKRKCAAHNAGICTPELDLCTTGLITSCGPLCSCLRSTGNAGFCGNVANLNNPCRNCTKDTDCHAEFGPGAACVFLGGECYAVFCPDTGGTACIPPCV